MYCTLIRLNPCIALSFPPSVFDSFSGLYYAIFIHRHNVYMIAFSSPSFSFTLPPPPKQSHIYSYIYICIDDIHIYIFIYICIYAHIYSRVCIWEKTCNVCLFNLSHHLTWWFTIPSTFLQLFYDVYFT
jgi:hypothetical protein